MTESFKSDYAHKPELPISTIPRRLPGSKTDREHQSFGLDRHGKPARRVVLTEDYPLGEMFAAMLTELRKIRMGLELMLGEEIDNVD